MNDEVSSADSPAFPRAYRAPVDVVVETPRGGFVKRGAGGRIDFVSPVPCPYNYGYIPGTRAEDGEGADAVVLGVRIARGATVRTTPRAIQRFTDAGCQDDKLICSDQPLEDVQRQRVARFFRRYARVKRMLNWLRGGAGATRCGPLLLLSDAEPTKPSP